MMDNNFKVNMNEYLPLRDVVFNTLRQAINNLVTEGLLVRKKGIGTIVVNQSVSSKAKNWLSFTQEMKA